MNLYVETAVEGSKLYCNNTAGDRNSVISHSSCRMDVTRLEQRAYIKGEMLQNCREVVIVPHDLHKLTVASSSISHSQYGYFYVGRLF